jgi:putative FmdB family regulatory protein
MPLYEYYCGKCGQQVTVTLSIRDRGKTVPACPRCGDKGLEPRVSTFFSQTSRKS